MFSREIPMTGKRTKGGLPTDTSRVRVDPAQTSFFEGREFRSFKELSIAGSATYVMRVVVPKNVILFGFDVMLDAGFLRLSNYKDGTAGGTWAETLPIFSTNNMSVGPDRSAVVTPAVVLTAGGTYANDGTLFDILRMKVSTASGQAASVGASLAMSVALQQAPTTLSSKTLAALTRSPARSRSVGKSGHNLRPNFVVGLRGATSDQSHAKSPRAASSRSACVDARVMVAGRLGLHLGYRASPYACMKHCASDRVSV